MSKLLTTVDAAAYLGVGTTSIKRWADQQLLPCQKTAGGHRRFSRDALDRFRRSNVEGTGGVALEFPYMSSRDLDALEMGVIEVSDDGTVLQYNRWESELSGMNAALVLGLNFFKEVAPCTNNDIVYGAFKRGIADGSLDQLIDYTFTYRMRPTNVQLRLYRHSESQTNWVIVKAA